MNPADEKVIPMMPTAEQEKVEILQHMAFYKCVQCSRQCMLNMCFARPEQTITAITCPCPRLGIPKEIFHRTQVVPFNPEGDIITLKIQLGPVPGPVAADSKGV